MSRKKNFPEPEGNEPISFITTNHEDHSKRLRDTPINPEGMPPYGGLCVYVPGRGSVRWFELTVQELRTAIW